MPWPNPWRGVGDLPAPVWTEFVATLVPAAILRYLAVAHYGRGRGEWAASEYPPFWRDEVVAGIARAGGVAAELALRADEACNPEMLAVAWRAKLGAIALATLSALYPDALPHAQGSADDD